MICLILLVDINQGKLYYKLEKAKFAMRSDEVYFIKDPFDTDSIKKCIRSCDDSIYCRVVTFKQGKCTLFKGGAKTENTEDVQTEIYVQQLPSKHVFN